MTSMLFFSKVVNHKIAIPFREHTKFKILNRMRHGSKSYHDEKGCSLGKIELMLSIF